MLSVRPRPQPKALVVDDQPADREHLKRLLEAAGWQVITAAGGEEAVHKAGNEQPDIVFLDIVMPDLDGFKACRRLAAQERTRRIPVVFVSTKQQRADHVWARMQGGRDLIGKPCTASQVLAALRHAA